MAKPDRDAPSRLADEFSRAVAEAISGNVQLLTRAQRIYLDAISSTPATRQTPDAATLWIRWVELGVRSYGQYVAATLQYWNRFTGDVEETLRGSETQSSECGGATRSVAMRLRARRGETASASFLVENSLRQAVDITFDRSTFVADTGESIPSSFLRIEPDTAHLAPGTEIVVKASIDVADAFQAGKSYKSVVSIAGLPGREVQLQLDVTD